MTSVVYRAYDADGLLLYIGCTENITRRMNGHRNSSKSMASWVMTYCMARLDVSDPMDSILAEKIEAEAIRTEGPLLNTVCSGVPGWMRWHNVAEYLEGRGLPLQIAGLQRCEDCTRPMAYRCFRDLGRKCHDCAWLAEYDAQQVAS